MSLNSAEQLEQARIAWMQLNNAEANVRRLDGYRSLNRDMQASRSHSIQQAAAARSVLNNVLAMPLASEQAA